MPIQPAKRQRQHQRRLGQEKPKLELVRPDASPHPDTQHAGLGPTGPVVRPDLTTQVEHFADIARELPPLFERHYREIALDQDLIPLDPDWDRYFMLALQGLLVVRTARQSHPEASPFPGEGNPGSPVRAGALVGYIFNLVGPHLHYRGTPHAEIEMFWLDPAYRGGAFVLRWFRENEAHLRSLGVKRIGVATKNEYKGGRVGLVFKRLGYRPVETTWAKVL